jgi:ribonuclease P protein component
VGSDRFPRSRRLLKGSEYKRVFAAPDVKAGENCLLLLARKNTCRRHRLGLAVAKKHIPTAVKRNLVKRLSREVFRNMSDASPHLDIVVLSRPAAASATRGELREAFTRQFERLVARAMSDSSLA